MAGSGGSGGGFANVGVCGQRGEAKVTVDAFAGFDEYYLKGEEGLGVDICVVRFETERVGDAPAGCVSVNGDPCSWAHEIEFKSATIVTDTDGVCGNSEINNRLGLSQAEINKIVGTRVSYGYVPEYAGHVNEVMKYDTATGKWEPFAPAGWDEESTSLGFDNRTGFCGY